MSEAERGVILKAGLLLVLLEGWTSPLSVRARLGVDANGALTWLVREGFVSWMPREQVARWRAERTFEELWSRLMPGRGCPVRLCGEPRVPEARNLR